MHFRTLTVCLLALCALTSRAQTCPREDILLDFGWRFHAGEAQGAERPDCDDTAWQTVDLPHDFQIGQPWVAPDANDRPDNSDQGNNVRSRLSPRGFKEMGVGWYRLTFTPADSLRGRRLLLDFEGIMLVGDVYLNGERIGGTDYGYLGFEIDVTRRLKCGEPNVLAVRADTRSAENSRWYTGGGLNRDVHLIATDPVLHFTRHSLFIQTAFDDHNATVSIQSEAEALYDSKTRQLHFGIRILDAAGAVVAERQSTPRFYAKQKTNEYALDTLVLPDRRLWSCEDPYLYTAEVTLYRPDGTLADRITQRFGVRRIDYSPDYGLRLNGKKVLLKGIANHHTLGALGAAAYPSAIEQRLRLLRQFGVNHIRTSHNPYSQSFLDLCDQYGILIVDELYDKWLDRYCGGRRPWAELWQSDVPEFVKRDRNHPCVAMWSLGNELQTYWELPYADWGITPYRLQRTLLRRYDDTRPVTVAMHPRGRNIDTDSLPAPLALETDVASYNYRYMYFPGDSRRYPHMMFYQSEASTAALGANFYEMDLDRVIGLAYWGAIDYLGESQGWPDKGWAQGLFDISLQAKPAAYYMRSMFSTEPTVHIGVVERSQSTEWNGIRTGLNRTTDHWNRHEGDVLKLVTYTNADCVELLLNGRSLGTHDNDRSNPKTRDAICWEGINYEPGVLEAVARIDGKVVARHRIETTTQAVRLMLTAENEQWRADGFDLCHVRVTAVDSKGRRVPEANGLVTLSTAGDGGRIIAVSNGDMTSDDINNGTTVHLYQGSALVVLRASRQPDKVTLSASAPALRPATLTLKTK